MEDKIKNIILSYCQGRYWVEFSIDDLDEMVEQIISETKK